MGEKSEEFCFIHAENKILNVHMEKAGGRWMCKSEIASEWSGWRYRFGNHLDKVNI